MRALEGTELDPEGLRYLPEDLDELGYWEREQAEYWTERGGTPKGRSPLNYPALPIAMDSGDAWWWSLAQGLTESEGGYDYGQAMALVRDRADRIEAWFLGAGLELEPSRKLEEAVLILQRIAGGRIGARSAAQRWKMEKSRKGKTS